MNVCSACGRPHSKFLTLRELAALFADPEARQVTPATMRNRGRRIASDLGLTVIVADGLEFVSAAEVDALAVAA